MRAGPPQRGKGDKPHPGGTSPIIEALCTPDDFARMVQFCLERRGRGPIDTDGLHDAADRVLASLQHKLREIEGTVLGWADAMDLFVCQWDAVAALMYAYPDAHPQAYAKQRQLEHSNDRPLTVCIGGGKLYPVATIIGSANAQARGCRRVFEDSKRPSGRMWSRLCRDCQPRMTHPERGVEVKQRAAEIARIRANVR
jgi:hypothetical protein